MSISLKNQITTRFRDYRILKHMEVSDIQPHTELIEFKALLERIIDELPALERKLIQLRYLDPNSDYIKDYEVMEQMQICRPTFMKIRTAAFLKLAPAMGIEVRS